MSNIVVSETVKNKGERNLGILLRGGHLGYFEAASRCASGNDSTLIPARARKTYTIK